MNFSLPLNKSRCYLFFAICVFSISLPVMAHNGNDHNDEHRMLDRTTLTEEESQALFDSIISRKVTRRNAISANAAVDGHWEPPVNWPLIPIHASILPDGRLIAYDSAENANAVEQSNVHNKTRVAIWDPAKDTITRNDANLGYEMFCSGLANTYDGKLFVAGGNADRSLNGINKTHLFDPLDDSWQLGADMTYSRWYASVTPLANGEMLITGGGPSISEVRTRSGNIRSLNSANNSLWANRGQHPWLQVAPNGMTFYSGPNSGIGFVDTAGTGRWYGSGSRNDGGRSYGTSVMYDIGKILVAGGSNTNTAATIDINGSTPIVTNTSSMRYRRTQHNATVLPDGKVLVTGGNSNGALVGMSNKVMLPEIWDPDTGNWQLLNNPMAYTRQYHSVALLLPDGRIFSGGGGLCGACSSNGYHYLNSELFQPPYLFKNDSSGDYAERPAVLSAPARMGYASNFYLRYLDSSAIATVSLIRLGSTTHATNMEQRFVPLTFNDVGDNTLQVSGPDNANIAPPGTYMLFLVNDQGVPSVARMVHVEDQSTTFDSVELSNPGFQVHEVADSVSLQVAAFSSDGLNLTYSAASLPPGLSINSSTGRISGSPTTGGSWTTVLTVRDSANRSSRQSVLWKINEQAPDPGSVTAGLIGYWPIHNNSAIDVAGSVDGVLMRGARISTDPDRGPVLSLDGIDDYLSIALNVPEAAGAVSFWFNSDRNNSGLFSAVDANLGGSHDRNLRLTSTGAAARLWNNQTIEGGNRNLADQQWHHIVYTHGASAGGQRLYMDNVLIASGNKASSDFTWQQLIHIGWSPDAANNFFRGQIDDIRYYNRALSASEVGSIYSYESTGPVNMPPSLQALNDQTNQVDETASIQVLASDPDNDALTYSASGLPAGTSINSNTGVISGVLSSAQNTLVTITVSDGSLTDSKQFNWVVNARDTSSDSVLVSGQAVSGYADLDGWQFYTIEAGAEFDTVIVELSGLENDVDLYVRANEPPTDHVTNNGIYDCSSTNGGASNEVCRLENTASTTWHIGLYGYRASPYTINVTLETNGLNNDEDRPLTSAQAVNDAVYISEWHYYTIDSSASDELLTVTMTDLSADVDLYVRAGSRPSGAINQGGVFDCASVYGGASSEQCQLQVSGEQRWYIGVFGYRASSYRLTATFESGNTDTNNTELTSLAPDTRVDSSVSLGNWQYYSVDVPSDKSQLSVRLSGLSADIDLYVRQDQKPSGTVDAGGQYDCGSFAGGTSAELCELDNAAGKRYIIGVYGYRASPYSIIAATDNVVTEVAALSNGQSVDGTVQAGEWLYYRIDLPATVSRLNVQLTNQTADGDLFVRNGQLPSGSAASGANSDCYSFLGGNSDEQCVVVNSAASTWYIGINGYRTSNYTLTVNADNNQRLVISKPERLGKGDNGKTAGNNSSTEVDVNSSGAGGGSLGYLWLLALSGLLGLRRRVCTLR